MDSRPKWRLRARAALEACFRNRSLPRFTLGLFVTWMAGEYLDALMASM